MAHRGASVARVRRSGCRRVPNAEDSRAGDSSERKPGVPRTADAKSHAAGGSCAASPGGGGRHAWMACRMAMCSSACRTCPAGDSGVGGAREGWVATAGGSGDPSTVRTARTMAGWSPRRASCISVARASCGSAAARSGARAAPHLHPDASVRQRAARSSSDATSAVWVAEETRYGSESWTSRLAAQGKSGPGSGSESGSG